MIFQEIPSELRMKAKKLNFGHAFTFKVKLTRCKICGERYISLEDHVMMKGDNVHIILEVMSL
jgi:hypothetical protein